MIKFQIISSISLPGEMFQPHTGTQTSLLVLKKLEVPFSSFNELQSAKIKKPIFMSVPKKIGHDQRGNLLPARDESGAILLEKVKNTRLVRKPSGTFEEEIFIHHEQVADDQLPRVLEEFSVWHKKNERIL